MPTSLRLLPSLALLLVAWTTSLAPLHAQQNPPDTLRHWIGETARRYLGPAGGNHLFYYPGGHPPYHPKDFDYPYRDLFIPVEDDVRLHAWFFPALNTETPKGTVIFAHGNNGTMGHHFGFATFLVQAGYNLLAFDYRGYGESTGAITREGLIHDVRAVVRAAAQLPEVNPQRLIALGHSLGGAKIISALAEKTPPGLQGVIVYAGFASYRDMAHYWGGPAGAELVTDDFSPEQTVAQLSPVPLLIVHGTADQIVPFSQGEKLFAKARSPKRLLKVPGAGHQNALDSEHQDFRKAVLDWLGDTLAMP